MNIENQSCADANPSPYLTADVELSVHAKRRFKQRVGLPIRAAKRASKDALLHGARLHELTVFQRLQLSDMMQRHMAAANDMRFVRVHKGHAYVFALKKDGRVVVVTVLPYWDTAADISEQDRRRGASRK